MGLFDTVRAWLSPDPPTSDSDQQLRLLLRASLEIVSAYGAVLERPSSHGTPIVNEPDTRLPFSKQKISQAIALMQQAIKHPRLRALLVQMLSPMEAQQVLSPQFEKSLESGLVLLETFVPASQVEAERKQWDDALKVLNRIDPAARTRFEKLLSEAPPGEPSKR